MNKKTVLIGGLVVAGVAYSASRTERGRQLGAKVLPKTNRVLDSVKETARQAADRAQTTARKSTAAVREATDRKS